MIYSPVAIEVRIKYTPMSWTLLLQGNASVQWLHCALLRAGMAVSTFFFGKYITKLFLPLSGDSFLLLLPQSSKWAAGQYLFLVGQPIRERFVTRIKLRHLSCFVSDHISPGHSFTQITAQTHKWRWLTFLRSSYFGKHFKGLPFPIACNFRQEWEVCWKVCIKRWPAVHLSVLPAR